MTESASDEQEQERALAERFEAALDAPLTETRLRALAAGGALSGAQLARAAEIAGGPLPAALWRRAVERALLFAAAGHLVAGAALTLVEVWEDLGQVGSLALAACVAIAPAVVALRVGPGKTLGRVLLTSAALLTIAVVAVADLAFPVPLTTWLGAAFVLLLSLPFAFASRWGVTWLVPLAALQVAAAALADEEGSAREIDVLLLTSGLAACIWLGWSVLARGVSWMRSPLVPRVESAVALGAATIVAVNFVTAGWLDDVEAPTGTLATVTLLVAAGWLTYKVVTAGADPLPAVLAIVACALVAATGVVRALEPVVDIEIALATAGLGLVAATAIAIWLLRRAIAQRRSA